MAKNTSIALSDHFNDFLTKQVQSGLYGSASEVVRAGLRLLEEREVNLAALRAEIQKGFDSGPAVEFDFDAFLARKRAEHSDHSEDAA